MHQDQNPLKDKLPLPLMASISALPPLSIDMYLPAIPGMAENLGTEISTIQNSLSIFLVSFGVGMLLFGPLCDFYGRRPLAIFGLLGFMLSTLALTLSPTAEQFLFFRFLQGLLGSAATVVIPAMLRDCFGKDTARGMSTVTMIMLTAPLVAPLLGSALLNFFTWRSIFASLTLYAITVLIFTLWKLPETLSTESKRQRKSFLGNYRIIFNRREIYPDVLTFMSLSLAFFTYLTAAPFVFITWFGVSETLFGVFFSLTAVSLILANFINVRTVSRIGSRRMMQLGLGTGIFFATLLVLVSLAEINVYWTLACFFMIVGSLGITSVNTESLLLIQFPNQASSAAAVNRTLRFTTGALVGPILAMIYTGTPVPIAVLIFTAISMAIIFQFTRKQKKAGESISG